MAEKANVFIIENEMMAATSLATNLERSGYFITAIAGSYSEAVHLYKKSASDIVLMDIDIRGAEDGVETAKTLMKINHAPLIYTTALADADTIDRVKHTNPSALLTKPFYIKNVCTAIDLALYDFACTKGVSNNDRPLPAACSEDRRMDKELILQMNDCLFIKQNYHFIKIRLSDILLLEADNNYVHLQTPKRKFTLRLSLCDLLERLNFSSLFRVHRSFAINLDEINSFDDSLVYIDQREIPIGRNYRPDFLKRFISR